MFFNCRKYEAAYINENDNQVYPCMSNNLSDKRTFHESWGGTCRIHVQGDERLFLS